MTFTDDNLQELKDGIRLNALHNEPVIFTVDDIMALLARLEAGERLIKFSRSLGNWNLARADELYIAWRKAAGK
jgi:hypothetical protein